MPETGETTETAAWPCGAKGCTNSAAYAIAFRGQPGHVHDCIPCTAWVREWADVERIVPLPCPHSHGDGTTWVNDPPALTLAPLPLEEEA